ncbi:RNA polymerase sigma-70 factor [Marinilabiliaceae bacterium JC017]|nr:RNA polymerase sigma-70 factor [Marinilabiliaceae bacterium JC017]
MDDSQINIGIKRGDEKVFEFLFQNYYVPLCLYSMRYLERRDLAEEVVSETFLRLWIKREVIDIKSNVKSYLFQSVYNNSLNFLRKFKKEQSLDSIKNDKVSENNSLMIIDDYSEQDSLVLKELNEKILIAIQKLPQQAKKVYILKRQQEMKNSEIAQELGLSVKTVEMHMTKALSFLREELKDYLPAILLYIFLK